MNSILAQIHVAAAVLAMQEVLEEIARKMDQGEALTYEDRQAIQAALDQAAAAT